MLKLGVFTVMVPDLTPEETARELKAAGYDGVEWRVKTITPEQRQQPPSYWGNNQSTFAPTPEDAHRARAISEDAGLEIVGLGTYIDVGDMDAVKAALEFAQICGAPQLRVGSGSFDPAVGYHRAYQDARTFLENVQPLAEQYGVKALIEIHHKTITPSAALAYRLVDGLDPQWIGVLHDAGNMAHEGYEDYRMGIELLGPYLAHVHVKNVRYPEADSSGVQRGEWSGLENGIVDFDALFNALHAAGYDGWIVVEDFSGARPSVEALRFNIQFLRDVISRTYGTGERTAAR
jgi:sugar phosphate isomerase/epimerase